MAKPKTPNQKRKYGELNKRLAKYVMLVESIYEDLNLEAAKIVGITDFTIDSDRTFMWSDYPQTRKRIRDLQERFVEDIGSVIYSGTSEEWKNSNEVQDLLANKVLQTYGATIGKEKYEILYQPNNDALKAFQQRKDKGFTISDKLWNQSTLYKQELEEAISCAIQKGTSAITLSKQISKYLLDFPQLQKDYKERFGKASRAMDCEYRSIRLAASEINMAYRQAENLRWQQMDFVVGYEIKLSNNHTCNGKPFQDICDILAGKYPKDFQWTGWHPLCRCYKIPILKTEEEFWEWDGRNEATTASVNEVKDVPDAFKKWVLDNQERISTAKKRNTLPYFLRDNKSVYQKITVESSISKIEGQKVISNIMNNYYINSVVANTGDGNVNTGNISDSDLTLYISDQDQKEKLQSVISQLVEKASDIDNSDLKMAIDTIKEECNKPSWGKKTLKLALNAIQGIATGIAANQLTPIVTQALALL